MNFTESEMWLLGAAGAIIFTLVGFIVNVLLKQQNIGMKAITEELSGFRRELKEELKGMTQMLQLHDKQIQVIQLENDHREEKMETTDYIVSDLKKEQKELHGIVLKMKGVTS